MSQKIDISIFTEDAQNWGQALNEATWKFIEVCPEKSARLFNTCKASLREAILTYASRIVPLAELGGVALTTSFVQEVPDKCDRIVWRGHYYHLPVNSEPTPRAAEAVTVDQAMIGRAVDACIQSKGRYSAYQAPETDDEWRAALTAALTPPSAKGE